MMTTTSDDSQIEDAFGVRWPNAETEIVQAYLANKTGVMLEMREAARAYFGSPYRIWNEAVLAEVPAGETFANYAMRVVVRATSRTDPGHDADATLIMRLVERSLGRVDWEAITAWWRAGAETERHIHSA